MTPQNWKLKLLSDHSGYLMPLNKEEGKGVGDPLTLARVINSDHQGEIGLLLQYNGDKDENVWNIGNILQGCPTCGPQAACNPPCSL